MMPVYINPFLWENTSHTFSTTVWENGAEYNQLKQITNLKLLSFKWKRLNGFAGIIYGTLIALICECCNIDIQFPIHKVLVALLCALAHYCKCTTFIVMDPSTTKLNPIFCAFKASKRSATYQQINQKHFSASPAISSLFPLFPFAWVQWALQPLSTHEWDGAHFFNFF